MYELTVLAIAFTYIGLTLMGYTFSTIKCRNVRRVPFMMAGLLIIGFAVSEYSIFPIPYVITRE